MKYREFRIKDELTQLQYMTYRSKLEEYRPPAWGDTFDMPEEMLLYFMVMSAIEGDWLEDVVEENEYGEDTVWSWKSSGVEYVQGLKKGPETNKAMKDWGMAVLDKWQGLNKIDPN